MKDFKQIAIEQMTKTFGEKTAVHDFSLRLSKGEFVTFLGPSGCGKSTALNCITGLIPITSGRILIDDECIDDSKSKVPPEKREFGMVFQNYALFPHLTVFDNIAFGLRIRKLSRQAIRERVDSALKLVHLEAYDKKYPTQMSGGEQQRVAIARCIVLEPRLLLLDEPLSNLDAKLRIELRYELKTLHERLHVTTIYVTHDQTEALALSDRIVVMRLGRIQQIGSPEEIFSDPANLFVADFMGFKNIWNARILSLKESADALEAGVDVDGMELRARLRWVEGDPRRKAIVAAFNEGRPVKTAVRPDDIVVGEGKDLNRVSCRTTIVEYQGQTSQVSAVAGTDTRLDFRSSAIARESEIVAVGIPMEKIRLFPQTEG
jgi:putative spermidine/putrescine transport system ATP-binding protein